MKKVTKITLAIFLATITGYSVYANLPSRKISDITLANIEALANDESNTGASSVLTTDLGNGSKCENGTFYSVQSYRIDCFGSGNLTCNSGTYSSYTPMGPCYEARNF